MENHNLMGDWTEKPDKIVLLRRDIKVVEQIVGGCVDQPTSLFWDCPKLLSGWQDIPECLE